jgi:hypothetical protein
MNKLNLNEDIHRIKTLMVENRTEVAIRRMIDKYGIYDTINNIGDIVLDYITNDDKIEFITNSVKKFISQYEATDGFNVSEIYESPILYKHGKYEMEQIEYFNSDSVNVDVYNNETDAHLGDYIVRYEDLPKNIVNEIFMMLLNN